MINKTGISTVAQNFLENIEINESIISWSYLNNESNENFIEMAKHLYTDDDLDKAKLLNPWSYIGSVIFSKFRSFLRKPYQVNGVFKNIDYWMFVENILAWWTLLMSVWKKDWDYYVQNVRSSEYYNEWNKNKFESEWNTEYILKLYAKDNKDTVVTLWQDYYLYVQEINWWTIKNTLFKLTSWGVLALWDEVPLTTIPETAGLAKIVNTWLKKVVYTLKVEDALIDQVKSVIYAIDRKLANAEKHFNEYTDQFKIFSNINFPENALKTKTVNWVETQVIDYDIAGKTLSSLHHWDWKADIKIISNINELLTEAILFIDKQYLQISSITDLPLFFLWQKQEWWQDSWSSKIKSSWAFYQRITMYRDSIETLYQNFLDDTSWEDLVILWHWIMRVDESELVEQEARKLKIWITSRKASIMKLWWMSEDEATKILEEIKDEQDKFWIVEDFDIYNWDNTWKPNESIWESQ